MRTSSTKGDWKSIVPVAVVFAAVNLFAFRLIRMVSEGSEWELWRHLVWRNVAIGFMASEVAALSMVLVFAPGRFVRRLAYWWAGGAVLYACWLIGIAVIRIAFTNLLAFTYSYGDVGYGLWLPAAAIVAQAPLWALRICFGWRWEREGDAPGADEVRWSLADMITGTALVAVSLGLARFVGDQLDAMFWMRWLYFAAFVLGLSLFSIGPAMALTLRRLSWWFGALVYMTYATIGSAVFLAAYYELDPVRSKRFWFEPDFIISVTFPPFLAFAFGLLLATLATRALGYRLVIGHPRPSGNAPAD